MANRNFANSRIYSGHVMPVSLDCQVTVGSTGAVTALKGPYVTSLTRMGVGAYKIIFNDVYSKFYFADALFESGVTGSNILASTGTTIGISYIITGLGNTTQAQWQVLGVPAGVTAAVGVGFVGLATAAGTGTGTFKAVIQSGITSVEVIGNSNLSLGTPGTTGMVVFIQCYGPTNSSTTTPIPVDPASGTTMHLRFLLSNSSVTIGGY